jgi:hypothetical protein
MIVWSPAPPSLSRMTLPRTLSYANRYPMLWDNTCEMIPSKLTRHNYRLYGVLLVSKYHPNRTSHHAMTRNAVAEAWVRYGRRIQDVVIFLQARVFGPYEPPQTLATLKVVPAWSIRHQYHQVFRTRVPPEQVPNPVSILLSAGGT